MADLSLLFSFFFFPSLSLFLYNRLERWISPTCVPCEIATNRWVFGIPQGGMAAAGSVPPPVVFMKGGLPYLLDKEAGGYRGHLWIFWTPFLVPRMVGWSCIGHPRKSQSIPSLSSSCGLTYIRTYATNRFNSIYSGADIPAPWANPNKNRSYDSYLTIG